MVYMGVEYFYVVSKFFGQKELQVFEIGGYEYVQVSFGKFIGDKRVKRLVGGFQYICYSIFYGLFYQFDEVGIIIVFIFIVEIQ